MRLDLCHHLVYGELKHQTIPSTTIQNKTEQNKMGNEQEIIGERD